MLVLERKQGLKKIIEGLNEVLTGKEQVQIALETMAGKGRNVVKSLKNWR